MAPTPSHRPPHQWHAWNPQPTTQGQNRIEPTPPLPGLPPVFLAADGGAFWRAGVNPGGDAAPDRKAGGRSSEEFIDTHPVRSTLSHSLCLSRTSHGEGLTYSPYKDTGRESVWYFIPTVPSFEARVPGVGVPLKTSIRLLSATLADKTTIRPSSVTYCLADKTTLRPRSVTYCLADKTYDNDTMPGGQNSATSYFSDVLLGGQNNNTSYVKTRCLADKTMMSVMYCLVDKTKHPMSVTQCLADTIVPRPVLLTCCLADKTAPRPVSETCCLAVKCAALGDWPRHVRQSSAHGLQGRGRLCFSI